MGEEEEALLPDYQHLWRMSPIAQGLRAARSERKRLGLGHEPIASMRSLFERQHIKFFMRTTPKETSLDGMAYSGSGQQAVLVIVPMSRYSIASYRWRFTAAHEYCHLLFDRNHSNWVLAESMEHSAQSSQTEEVRANAFAAAFLLPESGVKGEVESITGSETSITPELTIQLQRHFGVSHQTMVWRLFNLGLVSELERERLLGIQPQRMARQLGYDIYEDADELAESLAQLSIPPRYFYLAVRSLREGKISLGSFAEHLEVDLIEARRIAAELQLNGR